MDDLALIMTGSKKLDTGVNGTRMLQSIPVRIGKQSGVECVYCSGRDTVEDTVFECMR